MKGEIREEGKRKKKEAEKAVKKGNKRMWGEESGEGTKERQTSHNQLFDSNNVK